MTDVIPMRTVLAGGTVILGTGRHRQQRINRQLLRAGGDGHVQLRDAALSIGCTSAIRAETATITITVQRPMADGSFTNTATIDSTSIGDPNRSNNSSSVNTTVDPVADVEVQSKSVTPGSILAGTDATYVITFRNAGPSTAQGVTLNDQFNPDRTGDAGYTVSSIYGEPGFLRVQCRHEPHRLQHRQSHGGSGRDRHRGCASEAGWLRRRRDGSLSEYRDHRDEHGADPDATNDSKSATLPITRAAVDLIANVADVSSFMGVNPDPLGFESRGRHRTT